MESSGDNTIYCLTLPRGPVRPPVLGSGGGVRARAAGEPVAVPPPVYSPGANTTARLIAAGPPSAILAVPLPLSLPASGGPLIPFPAFFLPPQMTNDKGPMTVVPHSALSALATPLPALAYKNSAYRAIVSPCSALTYKNGCPQVSVARFSSAYSVSFDTAKSYPQRSMAIH